MKKNKTVEIVYNGFYSGRHNWITVLKGTKRQVGNVTHTKTAAIKQARKTGYKISR